MRRLQTAAETDAIAKAELDQVLAGDKSINAACIAMGWRKTMKRIKISVNPTGFCGLLKRETALPMVAVLGHDVHVVQYQGQRVVTLRQIDELHERPDRTASRQFTEHRHRFEEGRDFYEVTGHEIRAQFSGVFSPHAQSVILITERGYGKIVKG